MKKKKKVKKRAPKRVPKKTIVKKIVHKVEQEYLSTRFSFKVTSIKTNQLNLIQEINFIYTGVLLIPKSLKSEYQPKKCSLEGTYLVLAGDKSNEVNTDYNHLSKKDVLLYLDNSLRTDYVNGLKDIIKNEILPERNFVVKQPW